MRQYKCYAAHMNFENYFPSKKIYLAEDDENLFNSFELKKRHVFLRLKDAQRLCAKNYTEKQRISYQQPTHAVAVGASHS